MKKILVLCAMGLELKGISSALQNPKREEAPLPCTRGRIGANEVVLYRCGVGSGSARGAADGIAAFAPDLVINAGTAGGLVPGLKVGSVVACRRVLTDSGEAGVECDPIALERASASRALAGSCLTVRLPLVSPAEKSDAAARTGCSVCEMEAWHLARAASGAGSPFLALKAVSDSIRDRLPDFRRHFDQSGAADAKKVALYLASRPDEAARAARFVRGASIAMAALARVFSFAGSL